MDKILLQALRQLGCNEKQIRLYAACLTNTNLSLPTLAKAARLQRSTAYNIAAELVEMDLLLENHKTYGNRYEAVEPDTVLRMLEARYRQFGRLNIAFKEKLPELRAVHTASANRPRVRTYEGKRGVLSIRQDILKVRQEVLLWSNQASEKHVFDQATHELFVRERISKQIPIRVLAVDNPDGRQLKSNDDGNLRQTKLLPETVTFTSETYIYGDKVAVSDAGAEIFGVITENAQIAESQRAIFESVWSSIN